MAVLDLLGRRWTLRVLWELRDGPLAFRALRERCDDVSPSVLNTRLGELRATALVDARAAEGYRLSEDGEALLAALAPLHRWAARWARDPGRVAALSSPPASAAAGEASRRRGARPPRRSR
jgi:DNA-binding HxlR family transcriptional regulator